MKRLVLIAALVLCAVTIQAAQLYYQFPSTTSLHDADRLLVYQNASGSKNVTFLALKNAITVAAGAGTSWGGITGTLSNQPDLNSALNAKVNQSHFTAYSTNRAAAPAGSASWGGITGTLSSQSDLAAALGNKADSTALSGYKTTTAFNSYSTSTQGKLNAKEPTLGNPAADGYKLQSTAAGVRSWVADTDPVPASTVTTQAYGDAGTVGTGTAFARDDHKHGFPASTKDTTSATGILSGNGSTISAAANSTALNAVSGTNTGDVTLATNSGMAFGSGQTLLALGTPSTVTSATTNAVTTSTHSHAITASFGFLPNAAAQYYVPVSGATPFAYGGVLATGTGSPVLATSPVLTTPNIGTATATTQAQNSNTTTPATTAWARLYTQPIYATATALTAGTTVTWTPVLGTNIYTLTPGQSETINMGTIPSGCVGSVVRLVITTSGTSSWTLTAGTNLLMQGTLATGTVTAKTFIVSFLIQSTTSVKEISRTTAM